MTEETPTPRKSTASKNTPSTSSARKAPARKTTSAAAAKPAAAPKPATKRPGTAKTPESAPVAPPAPPTPPAPPAPPAGGPAPVAPGTPAPMLESDARMWAMLTHILALVALLMSGGTLAFLVPLIVWLVFRDRSALIDYHAKQNLNLQITLLVVMVTGTIVGFVIFFGVGFILTGPLMLAYGIYALVISIIAGVRANSGEYYKIPMVIRFIN